MKHKPLYNKCLIKMDEPENKKGGIVLPDAVVPMVQIGTIVAIGTGTMGDNGVLIPIQDIKVGDRVFIAKQTLQRVNDTIEHNGEKCIFIYVHDIVSIVTE